MRKTVPILAALLPYTYFVGFAVFTMLKFDSDTALFCFFGLYLLLSVVISAIYAAFAQASANFWVKVSTIPADLIVITFNAFRFLSAKSAAQSGAGGLGMALFVLAVFLIPYILSRTVGMVSTAIVCLRQRQDIHPIHIFLHLLPIGDLCSAAMVRKQLQQE